MSDTSIFSLTNKKALITGAGSGLGYAMAKCMITSGAQVIIADMNADAAKKAADDLGPNASWTQFNVTDTDETERWVGDLLQQHKHIDILVNNAGNHCKKPIEEMSVKEFESVLDVHVVGAFALTRALVPHMKQLGNASVLFTASMTSFLGQPYVTGYAAAKSAYLGLIRGLATELSGAGIRVNGIAPGWIDTPMLRKAIEGDDERKNKILGRTPMKKFGKPDDIGWAATYLASDAAGFVSGHVLIVDGGALIGF
ncbi:MULTISPECIES: SDR family NAD(P)-dependent oxidoreductase [Citrobacter]|jgi:gluconate 5-dehydrogenase|uniref:SDR family NAD(P)-dependent oxidoreductase n=1 Tax=Citrobacter TaxID=544 RepID=UPI00066B7455|nr:MULTISPECIES: glucose 1-dehydrogenase [Citrobacter]EGT0622629.1 glucose 1-dehydrogenase [Citrobacter braakii]EGT0642350.1 glucose 1-dehydrogenase [Citrobacter braakii]EHG7888429.1 glucose 1-dehydrogenase [Citrobacter braakii]ELN2653939.1 glucose 1-dehydrogenase [Citrobacter braakii]MBJ8845514.1 glucose 1-dehydrogenase [Citrobacter braakii]